VKLKIQPNVFVDALSKCSWLKSVYKT